MKKYKFEWNDYYVLADNYYNLFVMVERLVNDQEINIYKEFDNYRDDDWERLLEEFIADNSTEIFYKPYKEIE